MECVRSRRRVCCRAGCRETVRDRHLDGCAPPQWPRSFIWTKSLRCSRPARHVPVGLLLVMAGRAATWQWKIWRDVDRALRPLRHSSDGRLCLAGALRAPVLNGGMVPGPGPRNRVEKAKIKGKDPGPACISSVADRPRSHMCSSHLTIAPERTLDAVTCREVPRGSETGHQVRPADRWLVEGGDRPSTWPPGEAPGRDGQSVVIVIKPRGTPGARPRRAG